MKREIATAMLVLPIGMISLLPKSALAIEKRSTPVANQAVLIADRDNDHRSNNRWDNNHQNNSRWDNNHQNNGRYYQQYGNRRVWIPAHWEVGFLGIGRRWVEGHWDYRR